MQITMIKGESKYSVLLPEKVQGKYWLKSYEDGKSYKIISVEGISGEWYLNTEKYSNVIIKENTFSKVKLDIDQMYMVISLHDNDECLVYAETFDSNMTVFTKYSVAGAGGISLSIGRENCDISYRNGYVSEPHASLLYYEGKWSITDSDSTNGTFVNDKLINSCSLSPGDVIYIMGLVIIIGMNYIAINQAGEISLNPDVFRKINLPSFTRNEKLDFYEDDPSYFYRIPRFKRNISTKTIKIDSAPKSQLGNETPFLLTLGPSITMGTASVATGAYSVTNAISTGNIKSAIPSMIMSTSMLLGTMVWPFITKTYEKKKSEKREKKRKEEYNKYIDRKEKDIKAEATKQKGILNENVLQASDCINGVLSLDQDLWNRNMSQDDFLKFRVGRANVPLDVEISLPEEKFELDNDELDERTAKLRSMPKEINDAPLAVSLYDNTVTSVYGDRKALLSFARGIIAQNAFYYGYDDVKIVLIFDKYENEQLAYFRWLPHVWNNDKTVRFFLNEIDDVRELTSYFKVIIENRSAMEDNQREKETPYYLFYVFSRDLFLRTDFIKDIMSCDKKLNMSVILFFNDFSEVPKESTQVIALSHDKGKLFDKNDTTGKSLDFTIDIYYHEDLIDFCKALSNVRLDIGNKYVLPNVITFLELFNAGKIEHLNALERWKANDPTRSLKTEVGLDTFGDKFYIDLHQDYHGPHGLIAGMTGSGKSEFIMSFILSLAVNYHPDEVSFVLIDYKGGGMAKSFEKLPHTAGIITNLDGASIKRSLISIESELKRRQAIFSEAAKKLGISNIDIYKYQKAYRQGNVERPLSHVFIIADEFAELRSQQPEFMAQLISAARIGRSLGVHLILATQKPNGVVDDQIWSNSKFRVCLKVQDRADSMDMLKRPDAAALKETGRFYFQVGYNELFALGQSAWAGAPYIPSDNTDVDESTEIVVVNNTGKEIIRTKLDKNNRVAESQKKQLDAITEYLYETAKAEHIHAEMLSLPPLPEKLFYSELAEKYPRTSADKDAGLYALVGEIDDPANQRKLPLYMDFSTDGNAIVYGVSGSGKEDFIIQTLYDLISNYTSAEFNAYIIDLGSEMLRVFEKAPHIGGVACGDNEEKVENLFKLLKESFAERKKLFSDFGGSIETYREQSGNPVPSTVLVINNYEAFSELYDRFMDDLQLLTREGKRYGMHFLFTCSGSGSIRYKLLQNFKQFFVLQQNDTTDYSGILGNTGGVYPAAVKGRGIVKYEYTYEFQTAIPCDENRIIKDINSLCEALLQMGMDKARRIPLLPDKVDNEFLADYPISFNNVPFGVYKDDLSIAGIDLSSKPFICISALSASSASQFVDCINGILIDKGLLIFRLSNSDDNFSPETCESFVNDVFYKTSDRHKVKKQDHNASFDNMLIIIDGFCSVYDMLSPEGKANLELLLVQNISNYNVAIIIADESNNLKRINTRSWYSKSFDENGIWAGDGASTQLIFSSSPYLRDDRVPGPDYGFDFLSISCRMVKLLSGG